MPTLWALFHPPILYIPADSYSQAHAAAHPLDLAGADANLCMVVADGVPKLDRIVWRPAWITSGNTDGVAENVHAYQLDIVAALEPITLFMRFGGDIAVMAVGHGEGRGSEFDKKVTLDEDEWMRP